MKLTSRQEEMLAFISDYQRAEKMPPSTRTIKNHFGFGSQTTVMSHLKALAAKGVLEQLGDGSWGAKANTVQTLLDLPIFGEIPAGGLAVKEQDAGERISVDPKLFGIHATARLWALRIKGDSMTGACIRDGDIGIFEHREPRMGEIIAALVDDTTVTLKRLMVVRGRKVLRAANSRYPDIIPLSRMECQGVLVGLIRNRAL